MRKILFFIILIVLTSFLNYSYALTPEQVLALKKAGVSEKTIQLMLKQESDSRDAEANDRIGTREITDAQGNKTVIYSTGDASIDREEKEKLENAWKMLQNLTIKMKSNGPS